MNKSAFFILLFVWQNKIIAQDFTPPDTGAVRKAKVKSAIIYLKNANWCYGEKQKGIKDTGRRDCISGTYRYNKDGNCIFEQNEPRGYNYTYVFNSKRQCTQFYERQNYSDKLIFYSNRDYYPNGMLFHSRMYEGDDTLNPSRIHAYDYNNNIIEKIYYYKAKEIYHYKYHYTNEKDSKMLMECEYDRDNSEIYKWEIEYNEKGRISKTIYKKPRRKDDVYEVVYNNGRAVDLKLNGETADCEDKKIWAGRWIYTVYEGCRKTPYTEELPISDDFDVDTIKHTYVRDKKNNIIEDKITGRTYWKNNEAVIYTYKYEYWK